MQVEIVFIFILENCNAAVSQYHIVTACHRFMAIARSRICSAIQADAESLATEPWKLAVVDRPHRLLPTVFDCFHFSIIN